MKKQAFLGIVVDTPAFGNVRGLEETTLLVCEDGIIVERVTEDAESRAASLGDDCELLRLGPNTFLVPGFIDTHVHASQWPFAGTGVDRPLMADDGFLAKHAFPTEGKYGDEALAREWYDSFLSELVKQGTTTAMCYATQHESGCNVLVDSALERRGPRLFVGKVNMDRLSPQSENTPGSLEETKRFVLRTRRLNQNASPPMVEPVVTPRFLPTCTEELLKGLGEICVEHDVMMQTHISETIDELDFSSSLFPGRTDAQVLKDCKLLETRSVLAHCVHLVRGEDQLLKDNNATIAHCPMSNFFFAKEALPVKQLVQQKQINVALSTDVAGGYSPSMLNAMRTAVLASKTLQFKRDKRSIFYDSNQNDSTTEDGLRDEHDLAHLDALYLATNAGAKALGLENKLGTFDVGKTFDALVLGTQPTVASFGPQATAESPEDILQKIICLGDDRNVKAVYVAGNKLK